MDKKTLGTTQTKKIPGYSGYIPGVRSENVHGATYGKTVKQSEIKGIPKGHELTSSLRFMSTNQANYVDQMQYHDPLDDIVAADSFNEVPFGTSAKFFGQIPDDEDTFAKNAEVFYGDGSLYKAKQDAAKETIQQASSKFYDYKGGSTAKASDWEHLPLSYKEIKKMVYS